MGYFEPQQEKPLKRKAISQTLQKRLMILSTISGSLLLTSIYFTTFDAEFRKSIASRIPSKAKYKNTLHERMAFHNATGYSSEKNLERTQFKNLSSVRFRKVDYSLQRSTQFRRVGRLNSSYASNVPTNSEDERECGQIHELSCDEPYKSRIVHIQEQCRNFNHRKRYNLRSTSFKYDDQLNLVMCETPKAASTTWQLLLLRLSGFKGNFTEDLLTKWAYSMIPNKHFRKLSSNKEALDRVRNYTSFLITRHPFNRLVSAYYNKLSNRSTYSVYKQHIGRRIALEQADEYMHGFGRHYGYLRLISMEEEKIKTEYSFKMLNSSQKKDVLNYIQVMRSGEVSFPQFVKFLITFNKKYGLEKMDIHWRPQSTLCRMCAFNYSYIIRFENIVPESNRLLTYLQEQKLETPLPQKVVFPGNSKTMADDAETREAFKKLSMQEVDALRRIYKYDFVFHKYDPYKYAPGI